MKIDLEALAFVIGTEIIIREDVVRRGRRFYTCEFRDTKICLGGGMYTGGSMIIPASSCGNRFLSRSACTARKVLARKLRGQLIKVKNDTPQSEYRYFNVPKTLIA